MMMMMRQTSTQKKKKKKKGGKEQIVTKRGKNLMTEHFNTPMSPAEMGGSLNVGHFPFPTLKKNKHQNENKALQNFFLSVCI